METLLFVVGIATIIGIYALLALALNIQWGYAGLLNFGVVAFFGLGAYATGILTAPPSGPLQRYLSDLDLPFGIVVLIATLFTAAVAYLLSFAILAFRGEYLAIATLGFAEILRTLYRNGSWVTGGYPGIWPVSRPWQGLLSPQTFEIVYLLMIIAILFGVMWILERLGHAPFGRTLKAIREDKELAISLGKDTVKFERRAFVTGCLIMGLAGSLWAAHLQVVRPESFSAALTFLIWVTVILGGSGVNKGVIVGAALIYSVDQGLRFLPIIYSRPTFFASFSNVIVGILIVILILYKPEGLFGKKGTAVTE